MLHPLERARLEKLATDNGFDLTPVEDGDWLVIASSAFSERALVKYISSTEVAVGFESATLYEELLDANTRVLPNVSGLAGVVAVDGLAGLYAILRRTFEVAKHLPDRVAERFAKATASLPRTTEAERLVVQRVGQGIFRDALIDYWDGRCAVTGLDVLPLLRASHIKPWADCSSDAERLDVHNGLLLAPHLDAAFDGGWVTFEDSGEGVVSAQLHLTARRLLGLPELFGIGRLKPAHVAYLAHHRQHVFRNAKNAPTPEPEASFLYFAYGSNMASCRLTDPSRAPSAVALETGYVAGRRLALDKYSSRDLSGKCDCEATGNVTDKVYGVVYRIAQSDRAALDRAEGLNHGYRDEIVNVVSPDAVRQCLTYVATDKRTGLPVYDWYLEHVVWGALEHKLPADYIDLVRHTPTVEDKDIERAKREREIYHRVARKPT